MWTSENRAKYDRAKLRYPSDLTDAEWEPIASLIPPAKRGGRKRTVDVREVVNGLVERTFAWLGRCRRLAKDFENLTRNALAFIRLASIRLMARKLFSRLNFPDRPSHAHADDDAAFGMEIENDVFPKRRQQSRRPTAYQ